MRWNIFHNYETICKLLYLYTQTFLSHNLVKLYNACTYIRELTQHFETEHIIKKIKKRTIEQRKFHKAKLACAKMIFPRAKLIKHDEPLEGNKNFMVRGICGQRGRISRLKNLAIHTPNLYTRKRES